MHAFLVMSVGETASAESGAQNPQLLQVRRSWKPGRWGCESKPPSTDMIYTHIYIYTYVLLDIFQIIWFPEMGVLAVIIHFWDFHEIKHLFWGTPIYGNPHMIYIFFGQSIYWVYHCVSLEDLCAKSQRSAWKRNIVFFTFSRAFFPESVWVQGSPNSGGLYLIFSSLHFLIFTPSHLHIFSPSHLLIFTPSHLHACSLHIFSSSHLLIFTSSHFTSSHLHISSSHLLIFTSSHLHICSSSHLLIFTSSHLLIFTSAHLHIFTSSHLHIFSSCPLALFPSCPLALLPSCPLSLLPSLPSPSFLFLFWRRGQGQCQRDGTKRNPFARNEVRSSKTEGKLRFQLVPRSRATLSHETRFDRQIKNWGKIAISGFPLQTFRTKWGSIAKNWGKSASSSRPAQHFRPKWGSIVKSWGKIAISGFPLQPFRTKWGSIAKNWGKSASSSRPAQPFRTKWGSIVKNWRNIAISTCPAQPFRTKRGSIFKNWGKIVIFSVCTKLLCAVRQSFYV